MSWSVLISSIFYCCRQSSSSTCWTVSGCLRLKVQTRRTHHSLCVADHDSLWHHHSPHSFYGGFFLWYTKHTRCSFGMLGMSRPCGAVAVNQSQPIRTERGLLCNHHHRPLVYCRHDDLHLKSWSQWDRCGRTDSWAVRQVWTERQLHDVVSSLSGREVSESSGWSLLFVVSCSVLIQNGSILTLRYPSGPNCTRILLNNSLGAFPPKLPGKNLFFHPNSAANWSSRGEDMENRRWRERESAFHSFLLLFDDQLSRPRCQRSSMVQRITAK